MQYLFMLLLVTCLQVGWQEPPPWLSRELSVSLTWLGVAIVVGLAYLLSSSVRLHLSDDPIQRDTMLHRYFSWRSYHLVLLFLTFALSLYLLGWGWYMHTLCAWGSAPEIGELQPMIPGSELLVLAPFLVGLIGSWACFYDVERAFQQYQFTEHTERRRPGRLSYLAFQARQNLGLMSGPLILLIILKDLPQVFSTSLNQSPILVNVGLLFVVAAIFLAMPWILRLVLGLKPLPVGQLRTRLLEAARRLNFRCSNILVWNTRGGVANAMLIGLLPWARYIVFTDRLLTEMTPDEVEAVFGHEVGHVKHRHMLYYLGFISVSLAIVGEIWELTDLRSQLSLTLRKDLVVLPLLSVIGAYVFVVFGFLSRRCERQADIYGCRTVSCGQPDCLGHDVSVELPANARGLCRTGIYTFIQALEKVAFLNGISRDRPGWLQSWQHSTIARRVDFLQHVMSNPALEARFQKRVWAVKWLSVIFLGGILVFLGQTWGWANLLAF